MKNRFLSLFGLLVCAALMSSLFAGKAAARLICPASGSCFNQTTNPPTSDLWAIGGQIAGNVVKAYTEIVLDYTGSLYPTSTLGTQTLGSASFPWKTLYTVNQVTTGYNQLALQTTTQLSLRADPVGATFYAQESVAGTVVSNAFNLCTSTAANQASYVYIAVTTNVVVGGGAVAGQSCTK